MAKMVLIWKTKEVVKEPLEALSELRGSINRSGYGRLYMSGDRACWARIGGEAFMVFDGRYLAVGANGSLPFAVSDWMRRYGFGGYFWRKMPRFSCKSFQWADNFRFKYPLVVDVVEKTVVDPSVTDQCCAFLSNEKLASRNLIPLSFELMYLEHAGFRIPFSVVEGLCLGIIAGLVKPNSRAHYTLEYRVACGLRAISLLLGMAVVSGEDPFRSVRVALYELMRTFRSCDFGSDDLDVLDIALRRMPGGKYMQCVRDDYRDLVRERIVFLKLNGEYDVSRFY